MLSPTRLSAITLILTVLLCFSPVSAQEKAATDAKQENAELRTKALNLLESLAGQVGSLQSRENRARIASNLAASLWKHDEQRARALLTSVEDDIRSGLQPQEEYDARDIHTLMVFLKLRSDTVERIAKHDGGAAHAFFKATEPQLSKKLPHQFRQWERAQELELARLTAAESPELAVELGRKTLARELSPEVLDILRKVARKDKEQARILHKEILKNLKKVEFPRGWEDTQFMMKLLYLFVPPAADEVTYREYIDLVVTAATKAGCQNKRSEDEGDGTCYWVGSMMSAIQRVDPAQASKLKQWSDEADRPPEETGEGYADMEEFGRAQDVDALLALAPKHPHLIKEIHERAAMIALMLGNVDRARKIATEVVTDLELREGLLRQIDKSNEWHKLQEEQINKLERDLANVPTVIERVRIVLFTAGRVTKHDRKIALRLLRLADDLTASMRPGREQMEAELNVASTYCLVKNDRCFAMIESVVPRLNELVAAAVKLDGFDTDYMRENEWNMSAGGHIGDVLTLLSNNAPYFAWSDFDRAVGVASQFDRNEIRMMAQLKLAQGILAGPPNDFPVREVFFFNE